MATKRTKRPLTIPVHNGLRKCCLINFAGFCWEFRKSYFSKTSLCAKPCPLLCPDPVIAFSGTFRRTEARIRIAVRYFRLDTALVRLWPKSFWPSLSKLNLIHCALVISRSSELLVVRLRANGARAADRPRTANRHGPSPRCGHIRSPFFCIHRHRSNPKYRSWWIPNNRFSTRASSGCSFLFYDIGATAQMQLPTRKAIIGMIVLTVGKPVQLICRRSEWPFTPSQRCRLALPGNLCLEGEKPAST